MQKMCMITLHEAVILGYSKLCAQWVPKTVAEKGKLKWMGYAIWVYHTQLKPSKQQSIQWHHTHSSKIKKFKTSISAKKIMPCVFWDRQGIFLIDFIPPSTTIAAAAYYQILQHLWDRKFKPNVRNYHLLHDCAPVHWAIPTKAPFKSFKKEVLGHLSYSLNHAPSNLYSFLYLKKHLTRQNFHNDDEMKNETKMQFQ